MQGQLLASSGGRAAGTLTHVSQCSGLVASEVTTQCMRLQPCFCVGLRLAQP